MTRATPDTLEAFAWSPQPKAGAFVRSTIESFLHACPAAAALAARMRDETGTRFLDWIDTILLPNEPGVAAHLIEAGFCAEQGGPGQSIKFFSHPGGHFARIGLHDSHRIVVSIKADSVADFAAANDLRAAAIEGDPLSPLRRISIAANERASLLAIERHGSRTATTPLSTDSSHGIQTARWKEIFRTRARNFEEDSAGFAHARQLIVASIAQLGIDLTCDLFFAAEREYWQRRNRAAQVQKARQDRLGLGWANHDHHTYRASRDRFAELIAIFETLGFMCRERFYAGAEAGWGAQVLEQPGAGVVIFADVDLSSEELAGDFAHQPLPPRDHLGTVGLWCALHGEAFLEAGMHHLECQFDFDALSRQLESEAGVRIMKPFTDFPYLRQAFTEAETWPVRPERIERLLKNGLITTEQAKRFRTEGALGSHLENLERNDGFKGFNQTGVSDIISRTDPRRKDEAGRMREEENSES